MFQHLTLNPRSALSSSLDRMVQYYWWVSRRFGIFVRKPFRLREGVAEMFPCCSGLYMIAVAVNRKCLKIVVTFLCALYHQMKSAVDWVCWIL